MHAAPPKGPDVAATSEKIVGDVGAGGTNATPFGTSLTLTDATVLVDGKAVVEKGDLKVGGK